MIPFHRNRPTSHLAVCCLGLCWIGAAISSDSVTAQEAIPVKLKQIDDRWQLLRDGQPYTIRGAGGMGSLELLAECGGNSNRTWGVDDQTRARLDQAHQHGISVTVGIWLEHERHGFDYSDSEAVDQQRRRVLEAVKQYKDHPAVLIWGVGNEMEGDGSNPLVWDHVEELCKQIKQIDPNHPTMCVIAEMGESKIQQLHQRCPSVDIIGINSYGGAASVPQRYLENGGTKPYVVTEFGPLGTWEVKSNSIGAIEEPTSGQKAEMYQRALDAFAADQNHCLGSYAFLWGNKQEGTPTWFGLLLPDGKKLAAVDTLTRAWTGKPPANRCPKIESFKLQGNSTIKGGETVQVELQASDPENKTLQVRWELLRDAQQYVTGGDQQAAPPDFSNAIKRSGPTGATIKAPTLSGVYRIYAYVDDGQGAAVANLPILVEGKPLEQPGKKTKLPAIVFDEPDQEATYMPSGWMGNTDAIDVQTTTANPKVGKHCLKCRYQSNSGWGGVVWQNPENDWGDQPGGWDLSGAKQLTFWVRGKDGGETVKFGFGLIGRDKPFFDTAKKEREVELDKTWKKVVLDLDGMDLRRIKSGFYWSAASSGKPLEFYLDRIAFE